MSQISKLLLALITLAIAPLIHAQESNGFISVSQDVDTSSQLSDEEIVMNAEQHEREHEQIDETERQVPLTAECIKNVSSSYGIHHDILFAILLVEGGTLGKPNSGNKDGTRDLSLFQINEINLPELKSSFGISREEVMNNGCLGAAIAARHLLRSIRGVAPPRNRMEYLSMLARYHSVTPEHNARYALKLAEKLEYLASIDD